GLAPLLGVWGVCGGVLVLGADLDRPAGPVIDAARDRGLIVGSAGDTVLRLTPHLTVTNEELEHALGTLEEVLQ
ncbi:MAG: aminotransferase class III-fold pyridoxal phosphate-dependent enzyme, partial [Gaiellaceae bacterium]